MEAARTPLTLDILRRQRAEHRWCVANDEGDFVLTVFPVETDGDQVHIYCSFVSEDDIDHMVSYRWKVFCTVPENGTRIAVNFRNVTRARGRCWVDSLNHLNDEKLKKNVLGEMGGLYRKHKVVAEYFLYDPENVQSVTDMLKEASRGWMWQELALGRGVEEFRSNAARLCFELLRLGRDWYDAAKMSGDAQIVAMVYALEKCAEQGAEFDGCYGLDRLLEVEEESVARVRALIEERDELERVLMSAAGNLQNANIGERHTLVKQDLVAASLAVLCTMPEFADADDGEEEEDGQDVWEQRVRRVLGAIRRGMLRSALAAHHYIVFQPVPCADVTDLFGVGIRFVRFAGDVKVGPAGRSSDRGEGLVEVRRGDAQTFDAEQYRVYIEAAVAEWSGEEPGAEHEREVASTWVELRRARAGAVQVKVHFLITLCGLKLQFVGARPSQLEAA